MRTKPKISLEKLRFCYDKIYQERDREQSNQSIYKVTFYCITEIKFVDVESIHII